MHRFATSASMELSKGLAVVLTDEELNLAARMGLRDAGLAKTPV
ncbi:MAG TPA: hypothetical protein VIH72_05015 [Candidatus Acidoferrales bacterium]